METHWDRTWRRFDEAIGQKRRRDMNETRRDELVGWVADTLDARSQLTATELSHRDIYQDANEIIEAVTRNRDAEIREALEAEYERVKEENTGLMGDYDLETAGTLSGLSFAIGLAEEGSD